MFVVGISFLINGIQGVVQGPIRALGLQQSASYIAVASYWLLGLPVAWFLAFYLDCGVIGLLGGFLGASIIQCISYIILVKRVDWHEIAEKAVERIKKEDEALDEDKEVYHYTINDDNVPTKVDED